jgi:molecular chaperone GrpE
MHEENIPEEDIDLELTEEGNSLRGADVQKLKKALAACQVEKAEYLSGWQRARADFANLRKDEAETLARTKEGAKLEILRDILPVVDTFELAMANKETWEKVDKNWRVGVEHIYRELQQALSRHNLVPFGVAGDHFDPKEHHALKEEPVSEEKEHTIVEVLKKGWRLGERIIRPAEVVVGKKKE